MKIEKVQEYLRSLDPFLVLARPANEAEDFRRMGAALDAFRSLTVAEFVDFLNRAEDYARTGIVPTKVGKARASAQPKKSPEETVKEMVQIVCSLYEKALDADFRYEVVDEQLAPLGKLTVAQLTTVAKELEIFDVPKKKADILTRIARKVKERREFHDRTRMPSTHAAPALPVS